ncbi:hypothetical protein KBX06_25305 [Micromonospora sp. C31]|uniref:hypothetical protein n=1 Tax=Micromonospora sp. C31 TaxID=2824876 RepID=UPI001B364068|nr:hypothetical protein [Micromonospora sp. C31]MBQ1076446.1 hypothetical protein [Micromonospora sp. C31]
MELPALRMRIAITAVAASLALPLLPASPAMAADLTPTWFGAQHVTKDDGYNYGGWVDGNGPDEYWAYAFCKSGAFKSGTTRWAGDRRGSFVYCPDGIDMSGSTMNKGFFYNDN